MVRIFFRGIFDSISEIRDHILLFLPEKPGKKSNKNNRQT